jgi:hypothetical protein
LDGYGASFECPAPRGYAVKLTMEDLRDYLAVRQTDGGWLELELSSVTGKFRAVGPKAEWLLPEGAHEAAGIIVPLRWKVYGEDGNTPPEQHSVLAVFRVARSEACLVGAVNAKRHPDATERARRLAAIWIEAPCARTDATVEP